MELLDWIIAGIALPLIILLVVLVRKRSMELDRRIKKYKAEQEAKKATPGGYNPYQEFAELFNQDQDQKGSDR